jgi:hypothetical protein
LLWSNPNVNTQTTQQEIRRNIQHTFGFFHHRIRVLLMITGFVIQDFLVNLNLLLGPHGELVGDDADGERRQRRCARRARTLSVVCKQGPISFLTRARAIHGASAFAALFGAVQTAHSTQSHCNHKYTPHQSTVSVSRMED